MRCGWWSRPIAGRVFRVQQKSAGTVSVGTPLLELGEPLEFGGLDRTADDRSASGGCGRFSPARQLGRTRTVQRTCAAVEPWGFTKVSALGVEEQRVNVLVDIVSPRKDWDTLGEGYRLDAQIQVYRAEQALTVPTGALFRTGERWLVYLITPEHRARLVQVSIGHRNDRDAEVLAGLNAGDRVVVYPSDALHDRARVAVNQVQGAAP